MPPNNPDAAVAVALLEFGSDPAAVMAELWRVTRPGGRVVIGSLDPKTGKTYRRLGNHSAGRRRRRREGDGAP